MEPRESNSRQTLGGEYQGVWSPDQDIDRHLIDEEVDEMSKVFDRMSRRGIGSVNYTRLANTTRAVSVAAEVARHQESKAHALRVLEKLILRMAILPANRFILLPLSEYQNQLKQRIRVVLQQIKHVQDAPVNALFDDFLESVENCLSFAVEASLQIQPALSWKFDANNHACTIALRSRFWIQNVDSKESADSLKRAIGRLALNLEKEVECEDVARKLKRQSIAPEPAALSFNFAGLNLRKPDPTAAAHSNSNAAELNLVCFNCKGPLGDDSFFTKEGESFCSYNCRNEAAEKRNRRAAEIAEQDKKYRAIPLHRLTYNEEVMKQRLAHNPNFLFEETYKPDFVQQNSQQDLQSPPNSQQNVQSPQQQNSQIPQSPPNSLQNVQSPPTQRQNANAVTRSRSTTDAVQANARKERIDLIEIEVEASKAQLSNIEREYLRKLESAYSELQVRQSNGGVWATCRQCDSLALVHLPAPISGAISKQGGKIKTWKNRFLVLSKGHLHYFAKQDDIGVKPAKGVIHLSNQANARETELQEKLDRPVFVVETPARVFLMTTETQAMRDKWIEEINRACKENQ
jgi:hypothetical protein